MPKSSSESRTPISFNVCSAFAAAAAIATPSVISSVRRRGSTFDDASACATISSSEWSSMVRGDTLSATETSMPAASHLHSCSSAESSAHAVSGWMTPVSSVIGMKRSGGMRPSRGWFHRTSASTE